jgi:hypothetical protein
MSEICGGGDEVFNVSGVYALLEYILSAGDVCCWSTEYLIIGKMESKKLWSIT